MDDAGPAPGRLRTAVAVGALILIWGTTWSVIRIGLTGIPPLTGVSLRFGIAAALLLALARHLGIRFGAQPREKLLWVVNGVLSFCVSYGVVYWAEQFVPSGLTSVLFATYPLMVAALAHFALPGERLGRPAVLGVVVGFVGVAVIFSEDFALLGGPEVGLAAVVMLASPLASAVASIAVKRWGRSIHPLSITTVPMAISFVVMGTGALFFERHETVTFTGPAVFALLYLAVMGSAVTFTLYFWLLRHFPATRLALIAYTVPIIAVAIGTMLFDEPLTPKTVVGSGLVVGGVALAVKAPGVRQRGSG